MKYFLSFFLAIVLSASLLAQNFSISNIVFTPASPDTLLPNEFVNITYDYTKIGGDIRIGIETVTTGGGNSGASGYALKTNDIGAGNAQFTYFNGAHVDSVRFRFINLDWTLLYDTTVSVDYTFHKFYINNLELTPSSPGILGFGDSIKFSFNFEKSYGDVRIQPFALSNKQLIEKQITPVSPVYTGETGNANGFIRIDSFASVDQIIFQFLDANTNDTLVEVEENVYFSFTNDTSTKYSISNVVCDPPSPSNLKLNQEVKIFYDYSKPYGNVRIYVDPIVSEGGWSFGTGGSSLYTDNNGSGDNRFIFFNEARVEKLRFRFQSVTGVILFEHFEDVFFTITQDSNLTYSITDIKFTPPSPASLNTGDTINVKFNYSKPFGEVFFFLKPLKDGELKTGFEIPNLGTFTENIDSVETYIIYDIAASIDQLQIQMKTSLNRLLVEEIVNVDYTYRIPTNTRQFESNKKPLVFPNPANNFLNIWVPEGGFEYSVTSINGQIVEKGFSQNNLRTIDVNDYKTGLYIVKTKYKEKTQHQKINIR